MAHDIGLADILRSCDPSTFKVSVAQAKAWRAIVACRTEALGGHVECCDHCGALRHVYHSCRNRHCPQCQTRAKEAWLAARRSELLPVPYFHLVFTLPHDLNGLAGCDPRTLYELLFGAVSDTLTAFAANPRWLGGTPSFTLVLHTWKQDLGRHIHVHALVAGGALTADKQWISPKRGFLFPVHALSRVFRGKFIDALEAARTAGRLRHGMVKDSSAWRDLKTRLRRHDWVVYAKQPLGGPSQVLEYLGRYTHRVAISNERILGMANGLVRLRAALSAACVARRLQAHSPLRIAGTSTQGRKTRCGTCGALGADARSGGDRIGRGIPAQGCRHRMDGLPALPQWALRGDTGNSAFFHETSASTGTAMIMLPSRRWIRPGILMPAGFACVNSRNWACPVCSTAHGTLTNGRQGVTATDVQQFKPIPISLLLLTSTAIGLKSP